MRATQYPWDLHRLWQMCPSVGCLMDLCDENYHQLMRMVPGLKRLRGTHSSQPHGDVELSLQVLEQTPYTTLIHITYFFQSRDGRRPDPDAVLRAYHDSRQVEVVKLHQTVLPFDLTDVSVSLEQKWRLNLFVSKWLTYCVRNGHRFRVGAVPEPQHQTVC